MHRCTTMRVMLQVVQYAGGGPTLFITKLTIIYGAFIGFQS